METFGQRLKDLRNSRGISQNELSKHIGVSKSSVNMYERDEREPGFETLEAIADFFNVDMDYLLGREYFPEGLFTAPARLLVIKFFEALKSSDSSDALKNLTKIREEMDRTFIPADFESFSNILQVINSVFEEAIILHSKDNPLPPHTDGPQAAPIPQEGKDTTPPSDAPETPPEGE